MKSFGKIAKGECEKDRQGEYDGFHIGTALYSKMRAKSITDYRHCSPVLSYGPSLQTPLGYQPCAPERDFPSGSVNNENCRRKAIGLHLRSDSVSDANCS